MNLKKNGTLIFIFLIAMTVQAQDWEQVASYPGSERHHPVTFAIDNYGYLVTGSENDRDFFRYDSDIDSWEQMPDFPGQGRGFAYGVTHEGKAYMGFGANNFGLRNDLWRYDPVTETWQERASCPCLARAHPAMIAGFGKIWVGLGSGPSGNLNDWWEYDIATNLWTQQPDLPGPTRHHPFYFDIDGVPYVGFGHGADIYRDFYTFDHETDTWTMLDAFPEEGRVAGTQFSHAGKGYILSGQGEDHNDLDTGEFWEYTPDTDSWEQLNAHPGGGRWAPGSFVIGDFVYFTSGNTETQGNFNDMWKGDLPTFVSTENDVFAQSEMEIQPNPAGDYFQLFSDTVLANDTKIAMIDLQGKVIKTVDFQTNNKYDIADLTTGVYMVRVFNAETARTFKLLKL